jgi:hypothetical protein
LSTINFTALDNFSTWFRNWRIQPAIGKFWCESANNQLEGIEVKSAFGAAIILYVLCCALSPALAQKGAMAPAAGYHDSDTYQSDIAEVYVSMIGVRPLNAVIDELQPKFDLTADQALQKAVPDTLNSSESTLSSFKAALQVGFMFGQSNSTNSSNAAASGQLSPLSILTNFPASTLGPDYEAAASDFERVKLLNRSLQDIPHFKRYTPYIITIQISLIPHTRTYVLCLEHE